MTGFHCQHAGHQYQRGVGLVESMIVVAIVVVLASFAVPSFTAYVDKYRVKAASEAIYADFQYGRSMAIKNNTNVYFSMASSCWGMNYSAACDCTTANSCAIKSTSAADYTVQSISPSVTSTYITGTRGMADGGSTTVTITSKLGKVTQVGLSKIGRVSICSTNSGTSYVYDYPAC